MKRTASALIEVDWRAGSWCDDSDPARSSPTMPKPRTPTIFTTPQDAALAFYQAFEAKEIDAMMAAWAEDEDIVCVHPGGPRLVGFDAVRLGWEQLFAGDTKLSFRLDEIVVLETVGMAYQSAIEEVTVGSDAKPRGIAIATNVFLRTPSGWRLVVHHASPAPALALAHPIGPLH